MRSDGTKKSPVRMLVYLLLLAAVVALIVTVFHHVQFRTTIEVFRAFNITFRSKEDFINGYYMAAHAMNPTFQLLLPIFISVASEASR